MLLTKSTPMQSKSNLHSQPAAYSSHMRRVPVSGPHVRLNHVRPRPVRATDSGDDAETYEDITPCAPAFVVPDQSNPHYSAFTIDVSCCIAPLKVDRLHVDGSSPLQQ